MTLVAGKIWGQTAPLIQTPLIEMHAISVLPHSRCSKHVHRHKWNAFYCLSGELRIVVCKSDYPLEDVTVLKPRMLATVRPGEFHWFETLITGAEALEVYYPEGLSEDIVRENVGARDA